MKQAPNRLWILAFPLSVTLLVAALYVKKPGAREYIDRHYPWVKETIGKYAPPFEVRIVTTAAATPAPNESVSAVPPPMMNRTEASASSSPPETSPPPQQAPIIPAAVANPFDLEKVCADPARWPKTVRLKTAVEFPAVMDGKVVGKLRAPVGAETRVVKISNGQVGVEFRGGGAWLAFDRTDFVERARTAWH